MALLGLRQGEALALRWDDLKLGGGELRIRHTLTWLPWQHGCVGDDADPDCGRRAARCPRRHGGGPHLGPPQVQGGAAHHFSPRTRCVRLQTAGARIVELADASGEIYIHAKAITADAGAANARAFLGSQNFSIPSLRSNRELGLIIRSPQLVSAVAAVIGSDAAR